MKHADLTSDSSKAVEARCAGDQGQQELIERWLKAYGAVDPLELDLGTLAAIGERIRDGVSPSGRL
jgi:hypothetical protein